MSFAPCPLPKQHSNPPTCQTPQWRFKTADVLVTASQMAKSKPSGSHCSSAAAGSRWQVWQLPGRAALWGGGQQWLKAKGDKERRRKEAKEPKKKWSGRTQEENKRPTKKQQEKNKGPEKIKTEERAKEENTQHNQLSKRPVGVFVLRKKTEARKKEIKKERTRKERKRERRKRLRGENRAPTCPQVPGTEVQSQHQPDSRRLPAHNSAVSPLGLWFLPEHKKTRWAKGIPKAWQVTRPSKRFEHPGHAQEAAFPNVLLGPANMHCCTRFSTPTPASSPAETLPQKPPCPWPSNWWFLLVTSPGISGTYKLKSMAQQTVVFAQIPSYFPKSANKPPWFKDIEGLKPHFLSNSPVYQYFFSLLCLFFLVKNCFIGEVQFLSDLGVHATPWCSGLPSETFSPRPFWFKSHVLSLIYHILSLQKPSVLAS